MALGAFFAPDAHAQEKRFELVVTGPSVNIRAEPSTGARIVGRANNGDRFPALGPSPDKRWIRVKYKGRVAWISANKNMVNVREVGSGDTGTGSGGGPDDGWATITRNTDVRLGPDDVAPVVTQVYRGDYVKFGGFSKDKRFVRVSTSDGNTGWVAKADVVPGKREDIGSGVEKGRKGRKGRKGNKGNKGNVGGGPPPPRRRIREKRAAEVIPVFAYWQQHVATDPAGGLFGYDMRVFAPGAQIRVNWNVIENFKGGTLDFHGAYMFARPGGVNAPGTDPPVLLGQMVHRLDLGVEYRRGAFNGSELMIIGGYRFDFFFIQPQTLSYFFSNHYHTLNVQAGLRYPFAADRLWLTVRGGVLPGLLIETFGQGQSGSSGKGPLTLGFEGAAEVVYYELPAGLEGGLALNFLLHNTQFKGTGSRGTSEFDNAFVQDMVISAGLLIRKRF